MGLEIPIFLIGLACGTAFGVWYATKFPLKKRSNEKTPAREPEAAVDPNNQRTLRMSAEENPFGDDTMRTMSDDWVPEATMKR